jgi:NAD(P)H-nitrite reductase large subunit
MSQEHFVVIGRGPAGNQAAMTLREKETQARITLISKERDGFYSPHRIPSLIAGNISEEDMCSLSHEACTSKNIKLRNGQEVVGINWDRREVILDHKEILPFSGLIIALGGRPRIPEHLMQFQDVMFTLKTMQDARTWIAHLSRVESVLIMGGDLTSLAVTKALLHLQKQVYFMLNEDAFWPLRPSRGLFEEVRERLTRRGVNVLAERTLSSLTRVSDEVFRAQVDDLNIEVGMVGAFFGLVPNVHFLERSGVCVDRGILVNEYLNAGFEDVYAAGDCAQVYHPGIKDYWVSIGHDNAVSLGRLAALNLLGGKIPVEIRAESLFEIQEIKVNTSWWTEF